MACSIAVKRHHDFEHYSSDSNSTDGGVPAAKKLRPCSFSPRYAGASLNINFDKMSIATKHQWNIKQTTSTASSSSSSKTPCLPPSPNLKKARAEFEEAAAKLKPSSNQLLDLVYQEFSRMKRRTKLIHDDDEESGADGEGADVASSSSPKKENTQITLKQACMICERLLKQQEESLCGQYEQALVEKLSEQYSAYIKFSQDQLQSNNIDHSESYIS